jgi:hypothetical protein
MSKLCLFTLVCTTCSSTASGAPPSSHPQLATTPPPAAAPDAGVDATPSVSSPSETIANEAFGGRAPELPRLSRDGTTAAVNASRVIGTTDMSTYEVGLVDRSRKLTRLVVLDLKTASAIARTGDTSKLDRAALAKAAAAITKRLADGGYAAFPTVIDYDSLSSRFRTESGDAIAIVPIGAAKLKVAEPSSGLRLQLVGAAGKAVIDETFKAIPHGKRAADCGGTPHLREVWIDEAKKRVLLRVGYTTGGDSCEAPDGFYRLWQLP